MVSLTPFTRRCSVLTTLRGERGCPIARRLDLKLAAHQLVAACRSADDFAGFFFRATSSSVAVIHARSLPSNAQAHQY